MAAEDLIDEDERIALDLAEIVLLAAYRLTPVAQAKVELLKEKLQAKMESRG